MEESGKIADKQKKAQVIYDSIDKAREEELI
jgi:hypothetical protein